MWKTTTGLVLTARIFPVGPILFDVRAVRVQVLGLKPLRGRPALQSFSAAANDAAHAIPVRIARVLLGQDLLGQSLPRTSGLRAFGLVQELVDTGQRSQRQPGRATLATPHRASPRGPRPHGPCGRRVAAGGSAPRGLWRGAPMAAQGGFTEMGSGQVRGLCPPFRDAAPSARSGAQRCAAAKVCVGAGHSLAGPKGLVKGFPTAALARPCAA